MIYKNDPDYIRNERTQRERERERERESVCVCVRERERERVTSQNVGTVITISVFLPVFYLEAIHAE